MRYTYQAMSENLSTNQWPESWTASLIIPIPKKGEKMFKLSYYKSYDEQAGFRKNRSTTEEILNCRIIMEKYMDHQRQIYRNFIDFKKAFERVMA